MPKSTKSLFLIVAAASSIASCSTDVQARGRFAAAVWNFVEEIADSVCNSCDTLFVHPSIIIGLEGPVNAGEPHGSSIGLPFATGEVRHAGRKVLAIASFSEAVARKGRVFLAPRLRGEAVDTLSEHVQVLVEVYFRRVDRWSLDGAAVAVGTRGVTGWHFELKEFDWT